MFTFFRKSLSLFKVRNIESKYLSLMNEQMLLSNNSKHCPLMSKGHDRKSNLYILDIT